MRARLQEVLAIGASDATGYLFLAPLFDAAGEPLGTVDIDTAVLDGSAVRFTRSDSFDPGSMLVFARTGDLTGDGIDDFTVGFSGAEVSPVGPDTGEILYVAGRGSWPEEVDLSHPASRFARIHGSDAGRHLAVGLRRWATSTTTASRTSSRARLRPLEAAAAPISSTERGASPRTSTW